MPVENWSDNTVVAHLADDPQFTEDLSSIEDAVQSHPRHAVLDLAAVHFVNSSNLARLLRLRKRLHGGECKLFLCSVNAQVHGAFHATGLDRIFDFSPNVPTALATLQLDAAAS